MDAPSVDDEDFSLPLLSVVAAVLLPPLFSDSIAFLREADG